MSKVVRLTESDIERIVKVVLNERFGGKSDDLKSKAIRVATVMYDIDVYSRMNNERKKMESLEQLKVSLKSLKNLIEEIEKDIKRDF